MSYERINAQLEREIAASKIDDIFQATYRNILDSLGGEDALLPFDLANIRGSLTRAKSYALIPLKEPENGQEADQPVTDNGVFRV